MNRLIHVFLLATLPVSILGCLLDIGKNQQDNERYIGKVENATGTISQRGSEVFVIFADKETVTSTSISVFQPTNLPKEFQQDSLRVIFSGRLEKIDPNVRYFGHPLNLDSVRKLEQK
jgi:hypothetical protein